MKCYCCGRELKENEKKSSWHNSCIRKFFDTDCLPQIDISEEKLNFLVKDIVKEGYTIPGVQKKLLLHLSKDNNYKKLTIIGYPTGYILKPDVKEFRQLPIAEQLVMMMADISNISTVPHALIKINNNYAYITKRIDRVIKNNNIKMLSMEDFCQLDLRLTQDKYKGSYERCAKIIKKYSSRIGIDMAEFFIRLIFSFVIGNSDMHLKNFSLIETDEASCEYILSPAYDLLPVNVILPEDKEMFALTLNGKKTNLRKNDFIEFALNCDIPKKSAEKMIKSIVILKDKYIKMCEESELDFDLKNRLISLINERINILNN